MSNTNIDSQAPDQVQQPDQVTRCPMINGPCIENSCKFYDQKTGCIIILLPSALDEINFRLMNIETEIQTLQD